MLSLYNKPIKNAQDDTLKALINVIVEKNTKVREENNRLDLLNVISYIIGNKQERYK